MDKQIGVCLYCGLESDHPQAKRACGSLTSPHGWHDFTYPHKVDCSWCGTVIHAGPEPVSHGICQSCYDEEMKELAIGTITNPISSAKRHAFCAPRNPAAFL